MCANGIISGIVTGVVVTVFTASNSVMHGHFMHVIIKLVRISIPLRLRILRTRSINNNIQWNVDYPN